MNSSTMTGFCGYPDAMGWSRAQNLLDLHHYNWQETLAGVKLQLTVRS
jgi:hypothetical protein